MLILPAIDLIDGRPVRLTQGDYDRKTDYGLDPLEVAKSFEDAGAEWLHMVDLDGAKAGYPVNLAVLERVASGTRLRVEFSGGLRSFDHADSALAAGADRVVIGSRLASDLEFAAEAFTRYGEKIVAGIDTRQGMVSTHGWLETGKTSGTELAQKLVELGCRRIITTEIEQDGTFAGPDMAGLAKMIQAVDVPVIASGGVGTLAHLSELLTLPAPGAEGVIVGKALYEGKFSLEEAIRWIATENALSS